MNKIISIVFILIPFLVFAQDRRLLHGKAIADVMQVEYLNVKNNTTGTSLVTDAEGNFIINARPGDVLEFSSEIFNMLTHTLTDKDFKEELFVIRVEPKSIILDEVEISGLTGMLSLDSRTTDVALLNTRFKDEFDAKVINMGLNNYSGNMNFVAIFGMIANAIFPVSKSSQDKPEYAKVEHKSFSKILKETYPESFFTETIKVPREKLGLFLHFCNEGAKRYLLDPKNEAELIAYLKERYVQFVNQSPN